MISRGLLTTLLVAILSSPAARSEPVPPGWIDAVRRGMTRAEVRQLLGPPARVSRQVLFRRHVEQWHWEERPGRVEFNCVRGEEPFVSHVQSGT